LFPSKAAKKSATKFDAIKNTEGGKKRNVKKTEKRNDRVVLKKIVEDLKKKCKRTKIARKLNNKKHANITYFRVNRGFFKYGCLKYLLILRCIILHIPGSQ
jgi:hypothetical protein